MLNTSKVKVKQGECDSSFFEEEEEEEEKEEEEESLVIIELNARIGECKNHLCSTRGS